MSTLIPLSSRDVHRQSRMYSAFGSTVLNIMVKSCLQKNNSYASPPGNWTVDSGTPEMLARAIPEAGNNLKLNSSTCQAPPTVIILFGQTRLYIAPACTKISLVATWRIWIIRVSLRLFHFLPLLLISRRNAIRHLHQYEPAGS